MAPQAPVVTQRIFGAFDPVTNLLVGVQVSGETPYQNVANALIAPTYAQGRTAINAATHTIVTLGKNASGDGSGTTFVYTPTDVTSGCVCTGTIAGSVLTVSAVASGTVAVGLAVSPASTGIPIGTITPGGTGTGGPGTYNLSASATYPLQTQFVMDDNATYLVSGDGSRWHLQSTLFNSTLTIPNNTILGNVSGVTALASPLSATQATTLINVFTPTLSGAAPASGGGTVNFLRADGTWTPSVPANGLTNAQLAQASALTIKCNPTGALANVQDFGPALANQVLQCNGSGTALAWTAAYADANAVAAVKAAMTNTGNVLTTGAVGIITLNTRNATSFSAATAGYNTAPNGIITQWGTVVFNTTAAQAVTFPIAFPANLFNIQLGMTSDLTGQDFIPRIKSGTQALAGFTIGLDGFGGTFDAPQSVYWFATGN